VVFVEEYCEQFLILNVPEVDQAMLELETGDEVELGFGFRVARMHFVCPAHITHIEGDRVILTHPGESKKQPRRGFARVAYVWPVKIRLSDGTEWEGKSCNLSASGALMKFEVGDEFVVDKDAEHSLIIFGTDGREYKTDFQVIRLSHGEDETTTMAVHYSGLPELDRVHLELQVLRGIARRYLRVGVRLDCRLDLFSSTRRITVDGVTENASGGGALFHCTEACGIEANMRGSLVLDLEGEPMTIAEIVVLRVLRPRDFGCRAVLEFTNVDYESRLRLVEFLMYRLEANNDV